MMCKYQDQTFAFLGSIFLWVLYTTSLSGLCTMRMGHEQITMWKGGTTKLTAWQERATQTYNLFRTEQAATEVSLLQLEAGGVVAPTR